MLVGDLWCSLECTPACQAGGRGFKSRQVRCQVQPTTRTGRTWLPGRVAQLVERAPEKREVTGSTPVPTTEKSHFRSPQVPIGQNAGLWSVPNTGPENWVGVGELSRDGQNWLSPEDQIQCRRTWVDAGTGAQVARRGGAGVNIGEPCAGGPRWRSGTWRSGHRATPPMPGFGTKYDLLLNY